MKITVQTNSKRLKTYPHKFRIKKKYLIIYFNNFIRMCLMIYTNNFRNLFETI